MNKSQHKAGPAKNLFHMDGSIPAVRDPDSHPEDVSIALYILPMFANHLSECAC